MSESLFPPLPRKKPLTLCVSVCYLWFTWVSIADFQQTPSSADSLTLVAEILLGFHIRNTQVGNHMLKYKTSVIFPCIMKKSISILPQDLIAITIVTNRLHYINCIHDQSWNMLTVTDHNKMLFFSPAQFWVSQILHSSLILDCARLSKVLSSLLYPTCQNIIPCCSGSSFWESTHCLTSPCLTSIRAPTDAVCGLNTHV